MKKNNDDLLCLDSKKARTVAMVLSYLGYIFLAIVFIMLTIVGLLNNGENAEIGVLETIVISLVMLMIGFFVATKIVIDITKSAQAEQIKDNEILCAYIAAYDAHKKRQHKYYYIAIACWAAVVILLACVTLFLEQSTKSWLFYLCAITSSALAIIALVLLVVGKLKILNFAEIDGNNKLLQDRQNQLSSGGENILNKKEQSPNDFNENLSYMFPLDEMRRKAKQINKAFGLILLSLMFIVVVAIVVFVFLLKDAMQMINLVIITFYCNILLAIIASHLLQAFQKKFLLKNIVKTREYGDRYLANLLYIENHKQYLKKFGKTYYIFTTLPIALSMILGIVGAIIGVQHISGLILNIIAVVAFVLTLLLSNKKIAKNINEHKEVTNQLKMDIIAQEELAQQTTIQDSDMLNTL